MRDWLVLLAGCVVTFLCPWVGGLSLASGFALGYLVAILRA